MTYAVRSGQDRAYDVTYRDTAAVDRSVSVDAANATEARRKVAVRPDVVEVLAARVAATR